jgi:hypothetical protein
MILFFYKPKKYSPIIILLIKIQKQDEFEKLEAWTSELFQILFDLKEANGKNILIFSVIKDYEKSTINLVLPAHEANSVIVNKCHQNINFMNKIIVDTIQNTETELIIEIKDAKILVHEIQTNLMGLARYFNIA